MAKQATAKKSKPRKTATTAKKIATKDTAPTTKNLTIYKEKPLAWSRVLQQLAAGPTSGTYWLATTNPNGRPHSAAVGALWVDGKLFFTSGARTRKGRNLAANSGCALSASLAGIDVVFEGTAKRVTDRPTLLRLAERYAAQGWPARVSGQAIAADYSAPSAGPSPWNLYVLKAAKAFGVATAEPYGATRWTFGRT
jgi:pyridoxine/pyridoxamine 5'-phosphate oxidase